MAGGRRDAARRLPAPRGAAMEPRPDGRGKPDHPVDLHAEHLAAMEPRPDGRGKLLGTETLSFPTIQPQWSPGLMAGGRWADVDVVSPWHAPQWSPGLMAGGRHTIAT